MPVLISASLQMENPDSFTTLSAVSGIPASDPDDDIILERIKKVAVAHLPDGWKDWKVSRLGIADLLGPELDPQILNKLRFAIPTVGLAQAFNPGASCLSERTYRDIKVKLLNWPFCVGLIIGPPSLAARVRGLATHNEAILSSLSDLKPLLISRKKASQQLSVECSDSDSPTSIRSFSQPKKQSRLDKLERGYKEMKDLLQNLVDRFQPPHPDSEVDDYTGLDDVEMGNVVPDYESAEEETAPSWIAPQFNEFGLTLAEVDFAPKTKEQEPLFPEPKPHILSQGVECLRLGKQSFSRVRYPDVLKKLQAAPVFSALLTNPQLLQIRPQTHFQDQLSKMHTTLGSILHGLLLQREAFSDAVKELGTEHAGLRADILNTFLGPDSVFRTLSDDVLQYTCGRRAGTIDQRQRAFFPNSDFICSLLKAIPPSTSHLFDEEPLADLLKQNGRFFRDSGRSRDFSQTKRTSTNTSKPSGSRPSTANSTGFRTPSKAAASRHNWQQPAKNLRKRRYAGSGERFGHQNPLKGGANDYFHQDSFRGGRLIDFVRQWKKAGAPENILSIKHGYVIPFSEKPPLVQFSPENIRRFSTPGMSREIQKMIDEGVLEPSTFPTGFISKMFLVPKPDGTKRPIFNLKRLNMFLRTGKFRQINCRSAQKFLQKGDLR